MPKYILRKEIIAVCMESPLYFTMPLQKRLAFIKGLEMQSFWPIFCSHLPGWISQRPAM
jgi:hypothetical protein